MSSNFSAIKQLEMIIRRYPLVPVDIRGVVLDYIGRTGEGMNIVLRMNNRIYDEIFVDSTPDSAKEFLRSVVQSKPDRDELSRACTAIFPNVSKLLGDIMIEEERQLEPVALSDEFFTDPSKLFRISCSSGPVADFGLTLREVQCTGA